jgi:Fe-S-cluster-containing hydrogenase component 2
MTYFIGAACIDETDMSCVDECPVDCIYEGERKLYINPVECIDCGNCVVACPVEAVSQARAADDPTGFLADNARFFTTPLPGRTEPVGNPGGARKVGPIGADTEFVRAHVAGENGSPHDSEEVS